MTELNTKTCAACDGSLGPASAETIQTLLQQIDPAWQLSKDGKSLLRDYSFKGFAKAVYLANLAAFISDKEGHHADIAFGWGYCRITLTSHDLGGLSENDFIVAAKLDSAMQ